MGAKSSIEWTNASWTPVKARRKDTGKTGWHCQKVSSGCENCYSETFNQRELPNSGTGRAYKPFTDDVLEIFVDGKILLEPLRWKKPRKVFVCSMTDLFADFASDEFIDQVFAVMALCPQHTFQILTKRAERMLEYFSRPGKESDVAVLIFKSFAADLRKADVEARKALKVWPLPNVWLGVSVENQEYADKRIPLLLQTPAAKRFVSYEPALGPVDFTRLRPEGLTWYDCLEGRAHAGPGTWSGESKLDWVIVGGESGPGARPFNIAWARNTIQQCKAAGVACFVKQLGSRPLKYTSGFSITDNEPVGDPLHLKSRKGGDMEEWPANLRIREFPKEN